MDTCAPSRMGKKTTRRLAGRASLSDGHDFNADVEFELLHTFAEIGRRVNSLSPLVEEATDIITGRLEMSAGLPILPGQTMTLTLEDGTKLSVVTGFNGKVTGSGGFFR
jgi:hypothetical protein